MLHTYLKMLHPHFALDGGTKSIPKYIADCTRFDDVPAASETHPEKTWLHGAGPDSQCNSQLPLSESD